MLETLALMGQGFVKALTLINLLAMVGGVTLGIIIGCLPGLSAAMGVALMLPLTLQFSRVMLFLPSTTKASEFSAVRAE